MKNSSYTKKKESREKSKREFDEGSIAFFLNLQHQPILIIPESNSLQEHHHLSSFVILWVIDTLDLRPHLTVRKQLKENTINSPDSSNGILCHPPYVYLEDKNYTICGMSSILRFILKFVSTKLGTEEQEESRDRGAFIEALLGFRGGCLQACKEVSVWTNFCEEEALGLLLLKNCDVENIPDALYHFESHLSSPVRLFNAMKLSESPPHIFAEGPEMNLSDLILFPAISSTLEKIGQTKFLETFPLTWAWLKRLQTELGLMSSENVCPIKSGAANSNPANECLSSTMSTTSSLYKKDPSRDRKGHDNNKFFTRQKDVELALLAVDNLQLGQDFLPIKEVESTVDWEQLPAEVNPCGGFLPDGRKDRKGLQVGAMALQIQKVVEELRLRKEFHCPVKVVDFCAGGGHVGLLVAALLGSKVNVILVENKAESLRRASERVRSLGLSNVSLVESNLDYFIGNFDVGVALHACGSATDLVLLKCITHSASFVVSPCCYGAVTNQPPVLCYPRSKFLAGQVNLDTYLTLAHTADQTHGKNNAKSNQGQRAMIAIDSDRLMYAQDNKKDCNIEGAYSCSLVRMPEEATPKNHILVGIIKDSTIFSTVP